MTRYELGSAVLKWFKLVEKREKESAVAAMREIKYSIDGLTIFSVNTDLEGIIGAAYETGLSYYDTAYLYIAKTRRLTFVTEDEKLYARAREAGINVVGVSDLIRDDT